MAGTNTSGGDRVANGADTFPKDGQPSRPMDLTKEQTAYWSELVNQIPTEMLRRVDTHKLKNVCVLLATRDRLVKELETDTDLKCVSKLVLVINAIKGHSALFGMSPLDRRRIKLEPQEEEDDAEEWSD